jgi:hypothetical protein
MPSFNVENYFFKNYLFSHVKGWDTQKWIFKISQIPNDDNWTKLSIHRCLRIDGQFCPVIVE